MTTKTIPHFVNNKTFAGSVGDARTVIDAAAAAFPAWRGTSLAKRTSILFAFRELLNARKGELAEIITSRWLDPSHGGIELGFPPNS